MTGPAPETPGLTDGLRAMFDGMLEGVQLLDSELRYRYLNATASKHSRRGADELMGQRMKDIYPGIENTEVFRRIEACLTQRIPQQMINEFTYPDGRIAWFDLRMAPVPAGVLILSVDISEQKEAESALRHSVRALEDADRRKTELLKMLSHELRNPLAAIRTGMHIVRTRLAGRDAMVERAADVVDRQITHLARFVDDLLDANRLADGKLTLSRHRMDLGRALRAAVSDQERRYTDAEVALSARIPAHPVWIRGDEARLSQVFANLLDNALKFTPGGGEVELILMTGAAGTVAMLELHDTGVGIGAEALPHVFEPLFQEDRSLDRVRGGLGLGLTVARGLIELHGGSISVASDGAERGTRVRLSLPISVEVEDADGAAVALRSATQGRRVLLIEDNKDAATTMACILDLWGYDVGLATTGQEGIAHARANSPDIVLCDIGLPGMDGYEVARTLRGDEATRDMRLIAVTGYGREEDRKRALEAGFDLHLSKPVNPETLKEHLEDDAPPTAR